MDMATIEPQPSPQFGAPSFLPSSEELYKPLLQDSINHLLLQLRAGASDFSHFHSIFSRLVQTIPSPPVEIIWFYGAVYFHSHEAMIEHHDLKARLSGLKDLFHLLVTCSDSCSSLKRVAVLAPLVFKLFNLVLTLKVDGKSSFNGDIYNEIGCFLERIVSFISICCCTSVFAHDNSPVLPSCFLDLVRIWTFKRCELDTKNTDYFNEFFPAVSNDVHVRVREGCDVGQLAGIVMFECLLLRICLNLRSQAPGKEMVETFDILSADTFKGFRSCYFLDILLEMLLEPTISLLLLSREDELLVQKVLFHTVIFLDYPCSHHQSEMHDCGDHLKRLAFSWLFVAENAVSFLREHFDASQADAYAGAFFKSVSHSRLMGWLISKLCIDKIIIQRVSSSPSALFDWISELHYQVSDPDISRLLVKVSRCKSMQNTNTNNYVVLEKFPSIPGFSFCSEANDRGRKRKDVSDGEAGLQLKLHKYQLCDGSFNRSSSFHGGKKNEMDSPGHDDDMEIVVQ